MNSKNKVLVAFSTAWGTKFGGINSFNAEILPTIAQEYGHEIAAICVVLSADVSEINAARDKNVQLISLFSSHSDFTEQLESQVTEALLTADIDLIASDVVWLGHDRFTGAIALALAKKHGGRSALIHHMSYEHYEAFAENSAMAKTKAREQKKLFSTADVVFAVGPLLKDALHDMLRNSCGDRQVTMLVPGLPLIEPKSNPEFFTAFLSGRINGNSRKIKQSYLGVAGFSEAIRKCSDSHGLPDLLRHSSGPRLVLRGVNFGGENESDNVNGESELNNFAEKIAGCVYALHALPFTQDRDELFEELSAASVAMMPSWHEGFGLVAWEAIAASVPLILSSSSGAYRLLNDYKSGLYTSCVQVIDVEGSHKDPFYTEQDKNKLANAVIQVASKPRVYKDKAIELRSELINYYTWPNCAKSMIDALDWSVDKNLLAETICVDEATEPRKKILSDMPDEVTIEDIRCTFETASQIGRNWQREIAKQSIERPIVAIILKAIDDGNSSILLTGLPGCGKTCVMLTVQDELEKRAKVAENLVPLFIQTSEFADDISAHDRQERGLPEKLVEKVRLLAGLNRVIVVMDSLDVLSIAREHSALNYFLAQIDQLLSIPNVCVVTACRSFDRNYDRRIAQRTWDIELICPPLDWMAEVEPLLAKLEIDIHLIDKVTRGLICNPRELAMFVELDKRSGRVNAVTSQELAQQYLQIIVQDDLSLGDFAMKSIEQMALDMLKARSLSIPRSRFIGTDAVLVSLQSNNVLRRSSDNSLLFGHQTLLDVLVVSGAIRSNYTLNDFIERLPPVPFVRPSIRGFLAQLAAGNRIEFRKQSRTVLTGKSAFHIRRLVAESFAEQIPLDDDWSLIRELREKHPEVFQVIYIEATLSHWYQFWFKYLVPVLMNDRDVDGLLRHARQVSRWVELDTPGILAFWTSVTNLDWMDTNRIARNLESSLENIKIEKTSLIAPLLDTLISVPSQQYSFLGSAIARSVLVGAVDVTMLWRYMVGHISDDEVHGYDFEEKIRCHSHEFGNNGNDAFLVDLMKRSEKLLDLAVDTVERWSQLIEVKYGGKFSRSVGLLKLTSFEDLHSVQDLRHMSGGRILFNAIKVAILKHAEKNSMWWVANRERLCFSFEDALRYFSVLACTSYPKENLTQICRMLCDKELLESEFSFEIGKLLHAAIWYLPCGNQDDIQQQILIAYQELSSNASYYFYAVRKRAELVSAIPCHMRTRTAQAILDEYEQESGLLDPTPEIFSRGGMEVAPFSVEVFFSMSDEGVVRLLSHYVKPQELDFDSLLVGGKRHVSHHLCDATSLSPSRFLKLLHARWSDIPEYFRGSIFNGVANYLSRRHGNLHANSDWLPQEVEHPLVLAEFILDELERHPLQWAHSHEASSALRSIAYLDLDIAIAERLVFFAIAYEFFPDENTATGNNVDLIGRGINSTRGHIAEALILVAIQFSAKDADFPSLLDPAIRRFAAIENPAVRAMILIHLTSLQKCNPDLAFDLFQIVMSDSNGLWEHAETWLYMMYRNHFDIVGPILSRIPNEGSGKDLLTWGRISALAAFFNPADFQKLVEKLRVLNSIRAWEGAISVWTHAENFYTFRKQCLGGIEAGLNIANEHASLVVGRLEHLLRCDRFVLEIPISTFKRIFDVAENSDGDVRYRITRIVEWLNATAQHDPLIALTVAELYLAFVRRTECLLFNYNNNITQLLTKLFAQAEETEEVDDGSMLKRVVLLQDILLELGLDAMNTWLSAAERP